MMVITVIAVLNPEDSEEFPIIKEDFQNLSGSITINDKTVPLDDDHLKENYVQDNKEIISNHKAKDINSYLEDDDIWQLNSKVSVYDSTHNTINDIKGGLINKNRRNYNKFIKRSKYNILDGGSKTLEHIQHSEKGEDDSKLETKISNLNDKWAENERDFQVSLSKNELDCTNTTFPVKKVYTEY